MNNGRKGRTRLIEAAVKKLPIQTTIKFRFHKGIVSVTTFLIQFVVNTLHITLCELKSPKNEKERSFSLIAQYGDMVHLADDLIVVQNVDRSVSEYFPVF